MPEVNAQLKQLVKTRHLSDARAMFDKMPYRDEITWTNMISGYVNASDSSEALDLFSNMCIQPGLRMDHFMLSLALKACALILNLYYGELLHGYSVKSGFVNSVFVGSALLDMYAKIGKIEQGCRVFNEMPIRNVVSWTTIITGLVRASYNMEGLVYFCEMQRSKVEYDAYSFAIALKACVDAGALNYGRSSFVANTLATMYYKSGKLDYGMCLFEKMRTQDVVSWTTIITTYVQMGQAEHAIEAFMKMKELDVSPNEYSFAAIICSVGNLARIEWGEQLHAHVLCVGFVDLLSVANSVMTMYSKCGQLTSASLVFHGMTRKDVSWSTIIAAYSQGGYGEEAFEYLSWMRKEGPKPNEFAFSNVLSVCGSMAILEQGKQLHAYVLFVGLERIALIQSALINMYSKCGSIKEASKIFDVMENDDIVSWTAMIVGYAEHGHSQEAIDVFEKIPKVGLGPDAVSFIGVLTACSHAGLVDLGFHYFNLINNKYWINPSKEHYGCMIDLLCRAGRLTCRVQGDVDCGICSVEEILKLDPSIAGAHITLANIYATRGRWREATNLRKMMKAKGVVKELGWSWIKVNDQVSAFVAGDRSHPQGEYIYSMLDLLASRTKILI
ncbi:hypothetical protein I3760_01G042100 [Carya illinoinensis]|uniref:Pentatricopeptide repeat-containing protein n=1 Tax=Carya illinoinensis TaxID=32201 RepID=A0A922FZP0_CARIL|nr:hypothetical protein I3760_01G042100 [Carya illinoinensis]KAG6729707.1 hypothetical protein I3842_01G043800 [Carya illinoinensis]